MAKWSELLPLFPERKSSDITIMFDDRSYEEYVSKNISNLQGVHKHLTGILNPFMPVATKNSFLGFVIIQKHILENI